MELQLSIVNDSGESILQYKYLRKYNAKIDFLGISKKGLMTNKFSYSNLKKLFAGLSLKDTQLWEW